MLHHFFSNLDNLEVLKPNLDKFEIATLGDLTRAFSKRIKINLFVGDIKKNFDELASELGFEAIEL